MYIKPVVTFALCKRDCNILCFDVVEAIYVKYLLNKHKQCNTKHFTFSQTGFHIWQSWRNSYNEASIHGI